MLRIIVHLTDMLSIIIESILDFTYRMTSKMQNLILVVSKDCVYLYISHLENMATVFFLLLPRPMFAPTVDINTLINITVS